MKPEIGIIYVTAACYYVFNSQLFAFFNIVSVQRPSWKKARLLTFLLNYLLFMAVSAAELHLFVNWTLIAVFFVLQVKAIYRLNWRVSVQLGFQGALVGLAVNVCMRSLTALIMNQPFNMFDSRFHTQEAIENLKRYPIAAGFIFGGLIFRWLCKRFENRERYVKEYTETNIHFSLYLIMALYVYLILNLLIYNVPANDTILKLWCLKSGLCALIGSYVGMVHLEAINQLRWYEKQNERVRRELSAQIARERELEGIAGEDCLTGCCSREMGMRILNDGLQKKLPFSIAFVDLDDLKGVNDRFGHSAGDKYIAQAVFVLKSMAHRESDLVCRYGGDEFLVILSCSDEGKAEDIMSVAAKTLNDFSNTSEYPFPMSISFGVVGSDGYDSAEDLIQVADQKMYKRKKKAKGRQGAL